MTTIGIGLPATATFDVVGVGVNAVDHLCTVDPFPVFDSKQTLVSYDCQPGGQVATALVALQRCGVSNQLAVILVDRASGERTILMHRPAALTLRPDELDRAHVTSARVLHVDGYDADAAYTAATWAHAAGVAVVVDVDTGVDAVERLLALTDAVILSREFACALTGEPEVDAALSALAVTTRAPLVAITLGAGGVVARVAAGTFRMPGYAVAAVDTTGAGDVFRAGFIYGLLHEWELERTLRFANAAAALKCTRLGGRPGIPTVAAAEAVVEGGHRA